jgi:predicted  nucleic acid-binding Zn-ribbon protein
VAKFLLYTNTGISAKIFEGEKMNQDERNTVVERDVVVRQDRLPGWAVGTMVVLGLLAIGGLGLGWWATTYAQNSRQSASADLQTMRQGYTHDMDAVKQRMTATEKQTTDIQDDLTLVTKHLQITQGQLKKARQEAQQIRDDSKTQIAALNDSVTTQLATKASAEDVTAVTGQVGVVRTDLDATKTDLNDTKNNLQMARSELGTLIAKNHDEVDELRKLGERDYTEFTIDGRNKDQKVGNVTITLRNADPKKNKFDVTVVADDKRTDKKGRNINEPIFLYAQGSRRAPMEIVVNAIDKNKITGYLSVPKVNQPQATASTNGSM